MGLSGAKRAVVKAVDQHANQLIDISTAIHAHPELGFQEYKAVEWLTEPLTQAGFSVEQGVAGLPTAFTAAWRGGTGPTIALVAEYDALQGLGHACGHNIIGTAAVGAALALRSALPDLAGTVKVVGTPAEEGGGGKVIMCNKGIFTGLDAALLCHPANRVMGMRGGLAAVRLTFKYYGKASHAAVAPHRGISALDAVLQLFTGINQLRQFAPEGYRIHGIIRHGGDAANIVPAYAEAEFSVRAPSRRQLEALKARVLAIAEGASLATGARLEVVEGHTYAERRENQVLTDAFLENMRAVGAEVQPVVKEIGSSDMGNVGELCPMIHPYVKIADEPVDVHTPDFAVAAGSEAGMRGLIQAAKALAMSTIDIVYRPDLLEHARTEWEAYRQEVAAG